MAGTVYRRVADALRHAIETGEYPPGGDLPTVSDIAKAHGVSRETAHRAIRELVTLGLVESTRGARTKVRDRPTEVQMVRDRTVYRDEIGYFFDSNAKDWRAIGTPTQRIAEPPARIAAMLEVPVGKQVLIRERLMAPPGAERPAQVAVSYLPMSLVGELPILGAERTGPGGIYDRLEEHFRAPLEWRETISSRPATGQELEMLSIVPVVHVLVVTRESRIRSGDRMIVVEVNETSMPAERFAVSYAVQRDRSAAWPREGGDTN